jgi:hypothetical protein
MKKFLIIPMLFAFYMSMGQSVDSASIIGKSIIIGNLVVAQNDFPKVMNWNDSKLACAALGKGWRLPTKFELNTLYQNKNIILGFAKNYYWSSSEIEFGAGHAWVQNFYAGGQYYGPKYDSLYVRAIRAF